LEILAEGLSKLSMRCDILNKYLIILSLVSILLVGCGKQNARQVEIVCSFAPSKIEKTDAVCCSRDNARLNAKSLASTLDLSVITHSNGAILLMGTISSKSKKFSRLSAGLASISVASLVDGNELTFDLMCSPINNSKGFEAVLQASNDFYFRWSIPFD